MQLRRKDFGFSQIQLPADVHAAVSQLALTVAQTWRLAGGRFPRLVSATFVRRSMGRTVVRLFLPHQRKKSAATARWRESDGWGGLEVQRRRDCSAAAA